MSQSEVALRLGLAQPTVSNWKMAKSTPSPEQLKQLEEFLGKLDQRGREEEGPTLATTEASPFGVWVNASRTRKGLTVVELAHRSGLSPMAIYNLESGRIDNPRKSTREKLIKALGDKPPEEAIRATEDAAAIEGLGNLIDFDPHDEAELPEGPGIYVFYDVSQRPIYVGESASMKTGSKGILIASGSRGR